MSIYDKPVWGILEQAVNELPAPFTRGAMLQWFSQEYPLVKRNTVTSHITSCCVNDRNRHHYSVQKDILFKLNDRRYERYDPNRHGQLPVRVERQEAQVMNINARHRSPSTWPTKEVQERVASVCDDFTQFVEYGSGAYTGPSVYFHLKTVDRFDRLGNSIERAAKDERFCELLYATLVSWGMHRMDKGAKMQGFEAFSNGVANAASEIAKLSNYRVTTLSAEDVPYVSGELWKLITRLTGSATPASRLVANSKMLHHLLPHLVPPMDRANTAVFFNVNIQGRERRSFDLIFPQIVSIAHNVRSTLEAFPYGGFNSSETKVIDNAIIGYVLKHELKRKL